MRGAALPFGDSWLPFHFNPHETERWEGSIDQTRTKLAKKILTVYLLERAVRFLKLYKIKYSLRKVKIFSNNYTK